MRKLIRSGGGGRDGEGGRGGRGGGKKAYFTSIFLGFFVVSKGERLQCCAEGSEEEEEKERRGGKTSNVTILFSFLPFSVKDMIRCK